MTIKHFLPHILLLLPLSAFSQKPQAPATLAPSIPRLEAFANRLAQQAQQELRLGNRDDAFLYAEFALQYLEADNADARQALTDAWYCNDVIPKYLSEDEKPLKNVARTLWMPAYNTGGGWGGGWHDDVRFPWSMDEAEMTYFVKGRTGHAVQLPLHPDSAFLHAVSDQTQNRLTVFGNNTAQMRNAAGDLLFRFEVADSMEYVKFVGKGKHLLCRKMSGPTELRDAGSGKHLLWLEKGCCSGQQLKDSDWYCSARDSVVELFDLAAGVLLRSMPGLGSQAPPDTRDRRVKYFRASPGFTKLAAVQFDGTATLFDLKTGKRISTFSIGENGYPMDFSADGAILGVENIRFVDDYAERFSADLWDADSGALLASFDFGQERPRALAFAPPDDRVVFLLESRHVTPRARLAAFDVEGQDPLWTLSGNYSNLLDLISRRGNLFSKTFWDGSFASPATAFGQFGLQQVPRLQFSPDGKWLCAAGYAPLMTINVFEVATGRLLLTLDAPDDRGPGIAFSPDSRSLLVGQHKSRAKMASHAEIWDLETMTKRHDLGGQKGRIGLVGWSPDGTLALTHSAGNSLVVWDAASGQKRLEPGIPLSYTLQAGFSPDGKILAAIDSGRQVVLWSVPDGKRIPRDFGKEAELLAFSPDGRYLAVYAADNFLKLWNLQTGRITLELPCERAYFDRIYFSNDSRLILGSAPGSHTAWEVRTGKIMVTEAGRIFEVDPKNNVFAQNRSGNIVFSDAFSRQEKARLRGLGYGQGRFSPDGKRFAAIVNVTEPKRQNDLNQTSPADEGYYQIRLFDLDPDTILEKAGRMKRKKTLACEQLLALQPEKYLDNNSLNTLAGRILRWGDQDCLNCFIWHFADLAEQEPDLAKAQQHYARAILMGAEQSSLSAVYDQRANRYLGAGMPDSAVQDAEKALRLEPDNSFPQAILMVGQLMQGQYKNVGARLVENIAAIHAGLLGSFFGIALRHAETGRPWRNDRALQGRIEKCLRLISITDSLDEIDARRYHIAPLQFNHTPRTALLAELGLPDSTLTVYKTAMDSLARETNVYNEAPTAYQLSMRAFYDADYPLADSLMAEAARRMRDSLASQPNEEIAVELSGILHNHSWIAIFAQKPGVAVAAALESLELDDTNIGVLTNLGHGYLFSGQFDKALETYQAYMEQEKTGTGVLLTDFFDLRQAGIWHKDALKAIEAILGRPLTEEEQADYGR